MDEETSAASGVPKRNSGSRRASARSGRCGCANAFARTGSGSWCPKKRVEVTVERVPVEGDTVEGDKAEIEIGEDEIVVPVIEEEIVVEKRPVVKEEIRIRRRVVEETEVIEEDVRREEIEVRRDRRRDPRPVRHRSGARPELRLLDPSVRAPRPPTGSTVGRC